MDIEKYRAALRTVDPDVLSGASDKPAMLRMYPGDKHEDGNGISVYYAPFDLVNPSARVVLIGITPGESQMYRAWRAGRRAMDRGEEIATAISEVKRISSFNDKSGQMRRNLYKQLNHWGVPAWLGIASGESLFNEGWNSVQTTSLIQFPTFLHGKNYRGQSPAPKKHAFLYSVVMDRLVPELRSISKAVVFPLGPKVEAVMRDLCARDLVSNSVMYGMLHPSGENTYRFGYLCGSRSGPAPHRTDPRSYDEGRNEFRKRFLGGAV